MLGDTIEKDTPVEVVQARIKALDIQAGELQKEIEVEADEPRKNLLERVKELAESRADTLGLRLGGQARYDATNETVDLTIRESNWTRLERFKKWACENLLAISGVAIMAATLITSIIASVKAAARLGSKGVSALGKGIASIGKKLGPLLGPIFSLTGTAVSLIAKGASFLASNLWVLALFIVYILYKEATKRFGKKK